MIYVEAKGMKKSLKEWAEYLDLSISEVYRKHKAGTLVDCIETGNSRRSSQPKTKVGDRIGRLEVLEICGPYHSGQTVRCRCDCGNEITVKLSYIRGKNPTLSCGCLQKENTSKKLTYDLTGMTFGDLKVICRMGTKRGYATWLVENSEGETAEAYGTMLLDGTFTGRVKFSKLPDTALGRMYKRLPKAEFGTYKQFERWAYANGYAEGKNCMRKDASKPFTKDNIYFETRSVSVTVNGVTKKVYEWAEVLGVSRQRAQQLHAKGHLERRVREVFDPSEAMPIAERHRMEREAIVLEFAKEPRSAEEITEKLGLSSKYYALYNVIYPLLDEKKLKAVLPHMKERCAYQLYEAVK